jgi:hypothetical protein
MEIMWIGVWSVPDKYLAVSVPDKYLAVKFNNAR